MVTFDEPVKAALVRNGLDDTKAEVRFPSAYRRAACRFGTQSTAALAMFLRQCVHKTMQE